MPRRLATLLLLSLAARASADAYLSEAVLADERAFFTAGRAFEPLVADPRYPRFGLSAQGYDGSDVVGSAGTVSFGETIAAYRRVRPSGDVWEFGVRAALYATFDLGDVKLFNTDYHIGGYAAYRRDRVSVVAFSHHDSGHVGDEFLEDNPGFDRDNYVLDGVGALVSYDVADPLRVYGGATWYYSTSADTDQDALLHYGFELESPRPVVTNNAFPVAAVDVQHSDGDGNDWQPDVSVRAGVRLREPGGDPGNRLEILGEFYSGRNRNGQFVDERVTYGGIVLQVQL